MTKRLSLSLILGSLLGVACIVGVSSRLGFSGNEMFLLGVWLNRLILGLVIGLAGSLFFVPGKLNPAVRGLAFGLLVSFSLYAATEFRDTPGFYAGIVYGPIIDIVASKFGK